MYVLNTDILVGFLRGSLPSALEFLESTDCSLVKIPVLVEAELLACALKSDRPLESRDAVVRLLYGYDILPFDGVCVQEYARMCSRFESAGEGESAGTSGLVIASTAYAYGATLVTNDERRFGRISGLDILSLGEVAF